MLASSGGATNYQLTVTLDDPLASVNHSIIEVRIRFAATCHLPLATQSANFRLDDLRSVAKIIIVEKYLFFALLETGWSLLLLLLVFLSFGNSTKHKHIIATVAQCPANTCCPFLISSGSAFPVLFLFFLLSLCTFLMTILCYTFRLVQFQFSVSTADCYLNDSIPFCSRGTRGYFIVF